MLVLVLLLVVVAAALLVTSLVSSAVFWAWLSVAVSVVAAIALLVDWARRRNRVEAAGEAPVPAVAPSVADERPGAPAAPPTEAEPAEEDTDAADLLVVTDLAAEVRVVDERPRYHLADCTWLAGRPTLGLPVNEARELGFTSCAVCAPDRNLAAAHRTAAG
jgi:hypothetical protein